jgi:aromatic ring-opening dioxygenase catalytic subunit (LigB family)
VMFETEHPVYPQLQSIGREITQEVKPKAVVVFSAHWQGPGTAKVEVNTAESTNLIYDYYGFPDHYYKVKYPSAGSREVAEKVLRLLEGAGIECNGVNRGLDHGVFAPFTCSMLIYPSLFMQRGVLMRR